jgi:Transcriptional regulators
MRITQSEIAKRAGVSQVTVSQVLNRSRNMRISADKRQEIITLAETLNYQPRNLTTHTIGYVMRVTDNEGEVQTLNQMKSLLSERGYRLLLIDIDELNTARLSQTLNPKTVDGIIFTIMPSQQIMQQLPGEVPFVVLAEADGVGQEVDQVITDTFQSAHLVTQYLLDKGHRRICFVTGEQTTLHHSNLKAGFFQAFKDKGIASDTVSLIEVAYARDLDDHLEAEMQKTEPPTAFLGLTFIRVAKIVNFLQQRGHRVPEEISIASVFDSFNYQWLRPNITRSSAGGGKVAHDAAQLLWKKIQNPDLPHEHLVLQSHLIERDSVFEIKN